MRPPVTERLPPWLQATAADLRATFLQFTRIPMPGAAPPGEGWARRGAWAWPMAGAAIGAMGALAMAAAGSAGLPPLLGAILAVAVMALATGALHEDGLADCADGLGGGHDRAGRLRIMRDSRLGSYGALALVLVTLWRVGALTALPEALAGAALIACAAAARWAAALLAAALPPANPEGQSAAAGRPGWIAVAAGLLLCLVLAALLLPATAMAVPVLAALAAAGLAGLAAARRIGGQTGDVLGAAVQGCEALALAALIVVLA